MIRKYNLDHFDFDEIKKMAEEQGFTGNKVAIGIWATLNGFFKRKIQIDNKRYTYYYKIN